ncbi:hypothetical protein [Caulobacter sp. NIBR1757]|uniref:hypothetical protein n=1 Tax=Caulobacter sp. NIBR1757 TaxID=3016000 RepID=UPI0022F12017|nr:hypothetical protein [Caulobacter sp. NIBR1757]WGM39948.1 hypothetical protein AMEJIAPC_02888 [Caulobacter sp. NIBR1757]
MAFAAVLNLDSLNGSNGVQFNGLLGGDQSGFSVGWAGDVNGDGFADLIIGAPYNDASGAYSGSAYVVFGHAGGWSANVALDSLGGTSGFIIEGRMGNEEAGFSVFSAGDLNNDGFDDVVVGARKADLAGLDSGAAYVVFGHGGAWSTVDLAGLNGTNGFRATGEAAGDYAGGSVTTVSDLNGDGINDLVVAARLHDGNGQDASGSIYVLFGKSGAFSTTQALGGLDGTNGFRINGETANDLAGVSVASAGDVNGDGLADLIIGTKYADPNGANSGSAWVVFGRAGGFAADLNLSTLDGTNGFQLNGAAAGDNAGTSVAGAGDVNGDGYADIVIGAEAIDPNGQNNAGGAYVVFGHGGTWNAEIALGALNGTDGFRINGELALDRAGRAVAGAGDINGDGWADILIGAYLADPNGRSASGATYVVYGRAGFGATLDLSGLNGTNGFEIDGELANDQSGRAVSGAGDVNGDGLDDFLIGSRGSDVGYSSSGSTFLVFGQLSGIVFDGTAAAESRSGGASGDRLNGGGGNDKLFGFAAYDILDGGDGADYVFGGDGNDWLIGGAGNDTLNGEAGNDRAEAGVGNDILNGGLGADRLYGGDGNDILRGDDGADQLFGDAGTDTLTGGAGDDRLEGGDGNDTLDGGAGADTLIGGLGNDIYLINDLLDTVVELAGEGYEIAKVSVDGWVIAEGIEALQMTGSGDIGATGNDSANNMKGNTGDNRLDGGAGVDTIDGGAGADIIIGGLGNDLLRGGSGGDTFVVAHAFGPTLETDQIYDFVRAHGDRLDLSGIDADTLVEGDQAFTLVSAFTRHAGEMTLTFASNITTLRLDVNGDGRVDYQMKINGNVTGASGDWAL